MLFPLDRPPLDEVLVFGHDVVAGIGQRWPKMLFHADVCAIVSEQRVLAGLLLPVTSDHLLNRQQRGRGHRGPVGEQLAAGTEIDEHRTARKRQRHAGDRAVLVARVVSRRGRTTGGEIEDGGTTANRQAERRLEARACDTAVVPQIRGERVRIEQQAVGQRALDVFATSHHREADRRRVDLLHGVREERGRRCQIDEGLCEIIGVGGPRRRHRLGR